MTRQEATEEHILLKSGPIEAAIALTGAELTRLHYRGRDLLWSGDPAVWAGHAPVLFPIVGRVPDNEIRVGDRRFPMPMHGFARHSRFTLVERSASRVRLALVSSSATEAHFPYSFGLSLTYELVGPALSIEAEIENPGTTPLPVSLGLHPAFAWPLEPGLAKSDYFLEFDADDALDAYRPVEGRLPATFERLTLQNCRLPLTTELFTKSGLALLTLASPRVRFASDRGALSLTLAFDGFRHVTIWQVPGADFLCIEPLRGHPEPVGFDGDYAAKPGAMLIEPGGRRSLRLTISVGDRAIAEQQS